MEIGSYHNAAQASALKYHEQLINHGNNQQEAQLMLTNPRDALRGQSRSPNIVPFHMLGISFLLCNCMSVRRAVFQIFDFKKCHDLEIRVRGHSGH